MSRILVRYFAAAAEAAGCEEEHVEATTLGEAKDALLTAHPALEPVIAKGTFLVDGIASRDPARPVSAQVDAANTAPAGASAPCGPVAR